MNKYIKKTFFNIVLSLIFSFLFICHLNGQYEYRKKNIKVGFKSSNFSHFAFDSLIVLDNRVDTSIFCRIENNQYPPQILGFEKRMPDIISDYFYKLSSNKSKKTQTILLNIKQFRISNIYTIRYRVNSSKKIRTKYIRNYVTCALDAYVKLDKRKFKKILSINKKYYYNYKNDYNKGIDDVNISLIFNDIFEAISATMDSIFLNKSCNLSKRLICFLKDSSECTISFSNKIEDIDSINQSYYERWRSFPILLSNHFTGCGYFAIFDDFKENSPIKYEFLLNYDTKDSVYHILNLPLNNSKEFLMAWAIYKDDSLFLNIGNNCYLPLKRNKVGFSFHIPFCFLNIYDSLSNIYAKERNDKSYSAQYNNNIFVELSVMILKALINETKNKQLKERISKRSESINNSFFRNCYIDLDIGDIIY